MRKPNREALSGEAPPILSATAILHVPLSLWAFRCVLWVAFCSYLFSLAPLSLVQAQAAQGGGADRGVLGGLGEPENRSWRVRTSGGLI